MAGKLESSKKNILVLDDAPEILTLINEILGETYNIHLAKTVNTANAILVTNKIDLILLDLLLGDTSGLDFLKILKSSSTLKNIPVLMISSNSQLVNVSKATKLGAKGYIVKPINASHLSDKIYALFRELG
jgi:DNA-binding response OmpR family regulator